MSSKKYYACIKLTEYNYNGSPLAVIKKDYIEADTKQELQAIIDQRNFMLNDWCLEWDFA
ncbi:MAG: hypothetical protein R3321_00315 [Nitrososphaeraceae archaeon]|nr:hypothetical protein [Nitrososphaeraceae archaeon]